MTHSMARGTGPSSGSSICRSATSKARTATSRRCVAYIDRSGAAEPGVIPCVPDDIEALIALGRTDEARDVLEPFEAKARTKDRPWARAAALRCTGALAAADGEWDTARGALDAAAEQHARTSQPFETARTATVRGIVERRAKQKRAARTSLEKAVRIFDELDAPLWSKRARAELVRVVGEHDTATELTPTEVRVAHLVAEGKTNREVADALFVSVKTVEANLTRIFHKLGMRSRADLIRRSTEIAGEGEPGRAHRVIPDSAPLLAGLRSSRRIPEGVRRKEAS